jgi:hypothetical protein
MRLKLAEQFIALGRNLSCILLMASLFFASRPVYANCAVQVINAPAEQKVNAEFEQTLQLAFQNQLLFTVAGQKPFVLITDYGLLPVREFFNRLEMFRQTLRPGPANLEWLISKGPLNPQKDRPNDWIFFYNREAVARLLQDSDAVDNFERAGVKFDTPQNAIDFMIKRFSNREVTGTKLSFKDDLILGTLLGYPPSDVLAYANHREGARTINWVIEDHDRVPYYIATYRSYLPSDSPIFDRLRDQSHAAMKWFIDQRRRRRSLLNILLGN